MYDNDGNVIESAQPSAVTGYTFTNSGTGLDVTLNDTGLIDVSAYYASTTATTTTAGGVAGYLQASGVQEGSSGKPDWQSSVDYIAATGSGADATTIYETCDSTQYQDDCSYWTPPTPASTASLAGANTTIDHYQFNLSGPVPAIVSQTTVLSVVGNGQNGTPAQHGSGTATASTDVYNSLGQLVWSKDADGSISYTAYDPATGAVVEQIQDANVNSDNSAQYPAADWALLPSTWQTTGAAAKNRTSTYLVDSQGRTVEETDPDGNVTWTVYNDFVQNVSDGGGTATILSQTRTYPGWHEVSPGNYQTTGPVQVSQEVVAEDGTDYTDSLSYSWTGALPTKIVDGLTAPKGQEDFTTSAAVIQSLSRSITNAQGQVVSSLQYTSMPGTGYWESTAAFGTKGQNYLETDTIYDPLGRTEATIDPTGTIDSSVYDGQGRVTDQWKGTNDSGATESLPDGSGQAGTIGGGTSWVAGSAPGGNSCLEFEGTGYVTVPRQDTENPAGGLTLSVWVNPSQLPDPGSTCTLLDTHDPAGSSGASADGGYSLVLNSDGTLTWEMNGLGSVSSETSASVGTGGWYFICAEYDPAARQLLLSLGQQGGTLSTFSAAVSGTPAWNPNDTDNDLVLGNSANFDAGLVGSLSDVRLYGQAISSTQIANLYSGAEPTGVTWPVAEWRLNEGDGESVAGNYGNNMLRTLHSVYDPDGNLIESETYVDPTGSAPPRTTYYQFDWQDRQIGTLAADGVATIDTLDNQGETTEEQTFADAIYNTSTDQIVYASTDLRAQSVSEYDSNGRVYESRTYYVDPSSGAVGDYLPTDTWYDANGNVLATRTGGGPIEKSLYNGAGEVVETFTCADSTPTADLSYAQATTLQSTDTVVEQEQTWYDADGNTIATADYQRLPGDTTTTGALTAANSYVTATVSFYDLAGRDIEDVNYGREDIGLAAGQTNYFFDSSGNLIAASDGNPAVVEAAPPAPNSSDDYIVSQTVYDDTSPTGPIVETIDNVGVITETQSDLMGRTVRTIQNYDGLPYGATGSGFTSSGYVLASDMAQDVTTDYQYDAAGRLVAQTAYDANGSTVVPEATRYLYTSPIDGSLRTVEVDPNSTDELSPDANGDWTITTGTDHTTTTYDLAGETLTSTDQRGVTHAYKYNSDGQQTSDSVTSFGTIPTAAQAVAAIVTAYNDVGACKRSPATTRPTLPIGFRPTSSTRTNMPMTGGVMKPPSGRRSPARWTPAARPVYNTLMLTARTARAWRRPTSA